VGVRVFWILLLDLLKFLLQCKVFVSASLTQDNAAKFIEVPFGQIDRKLLQPAKADWVCPGILGQNPRERPQFSVRLAALGAQSGLEVGAKVIKRLLLCNKITGYSAGEKRDGARNQWLRERLRRELAF
jgi:hypothetical protein